MSANNLPKELTAGRRQLLLGGLAAGTAAVVAKTAMAGSPSPSPTSTIIAPTASPPTTPFIQPLTVMTTKQPVTQLNPTATRETCNGELPRPNHQGWDNHAVQELYEMHVMPAQHSFHPELPTQTIWGYDGIMPGPTFKARYGKPILVRVFNDLPANHVGYGMPSISTHLHNLHNPSESDGFPTYFHNPGTFKDHHYVNCYAGYDTNDATNGDPREALGTLWYHDHRLDFTGPNTYKGLSGFYLIYDHIDSGDENDPNPQALRLPSGEFDVPLVFHDRVFDSGGYIFFDQFNTDGIIGDKFLVNGKIQPYFEVKRRKYRFRLLDGGPSRFYEFVLSNGQPFTYISNDGNLLPAPLTMQSVRIGVAERADVVIDFSNIPIGGKIYLQNRLEQTDGRKPSGKILSTPINLLEFRVTGDAADPSRVPAQLRELPTFDVAEATTQRTFDFNRTNGAWTINGKIADMNVPSFTVKKGSAEIWTLRNTSGGWAHPVHIHYEEGRILTRNGKIPPPHERGRKDVYVLYPGDEIKFFIRFRDFIGRYPMHCHNTIHEDHAMMLRFDVVN